MTRVHFVCGVRALREYRAANQVAEAVARRFTVGRDEVDASVARLIDDHKALTRRVRTLAEVAAQVEAQELLAAVAPTNGLRVVARIFSDRDFDEVKLIAHRLVAHDSVVALLAVRERETARLVFARAANLSIDANALLREACVKLGGRGGGKPDFAQGGGANGDALEAALAAAQAALPVSEARP